MVGRKASKLEDDLQDLENVKVPSHHASQQEIGGGEQNINEDVGEVDEEDADLHYQSRKP